MIAALSRPLLCLACMLLLGNAWAYADEAVKVQVVQDGQAIVVDMHMHSTASVREAWSVLTDFAHMPSFVPNLKSSKVLEAHGNLLKVQQQGSAKHGCLLILNPCEKSSCSRTSKSIRTASAVLSRK